MRFHSDTLWHEIEQLARSGRRKIAAFAYVTTDDILFFGPDDVLVCDATDGSIRSGSTDRNVLRRAHDRGASLWSYPGLHAKVIVFEDNAILGSANVSHSSRHNLVEAGLVVSDSECVAEMQRFVLSLTEDGDRIDIAFLDRIDKLQIQPRTPISRRRADLGGEVPQRTLTLDELRAYAASHQGEEWHTLGNENGKRSKPYRFEVMEWGIRVEYKLHQQEPPNLKITNSALDKFCSEFNRNFGQRPSFAPGDYPKSFRQSYLIPIVKRMFTED